MQRGPAPRREVSELPVPIPERKGDREHFQLCPQPVIRSEEPAGILYPGIVAGRPVSGEAYGSGGISGRDLPASPLCAGGIRKGRDPREEQQRL